MTKVWFIRHGLTQDNVEGILQGIENGVINKAGRKQIQELINVLKQKKISKVISSDLPRCKATAEMIAKEIPLKVEYTDLLREKNNGRWVGKKHKAVNWNRLKGTFETRKPPKGESLIELRDRGRDFYNMMKSKNSDTKDIILVISHGAFLKVLIGDLLGMSLYNSIFKIFIDHCSISELVYNEDFRDNYRINFINNCSHLPNIGV